MADITLTITNVSPTEARAAQFQLSLINARRAAQIPPLPPFANIRDAVVDHLLTVQLPGWIEAEAESELTVEDWRDAIKAATDAQRAAAFTALTT